MPKNVPSHLINSSAGIKVWVGHNFPIELLREFASFSSSVQCHGAMILDILYETFCFVSGSFSDLLCVPSVLQCHHKVLGLGSFSSTVLGAWCVLSPR